MSVAIYKLLAEMIVLLHFLFVVFVVIGGLAVLRWPKMAYVHVPALVWGAYVEFSGTVCPLTPLEKHFRHLAGMTTYDGGFINQYIMPALYPADLTHEFQILLGVLLVLLNIVIYGLILWRCRPAKGGR